MPHKTLRLAFTQPALMKEFRERLPDAKFSQFEAGEVCRNLDKADIFILDDAAAMTLADCEHPARPSLFVAAKEGGELPESFARGYVDDLIALPLRALDVVRVVRLHEQIQALHALESSSRAIPGMVKRLQEDVQLAQKIQRRLIKDKFPAMGGLSVKSKYWCGLKAGGDYFDVFEFPDQNHVGIILADSSSYALSTHFLGSLMQFSVHVGGQGELDDPVAIVRALHGKIREGMKDKDRFSLFYGILDRKTYKLRYVDCGGVYAAHRGMEGNKFWFAKGDKAPLTKAAAELPEVREVHLEPGDRMFLFSDGWSEGLGKPFENVVERLAREHGDAQDFLNEMAFSLRKGVEANQDPEDKSEEFPMPPQDCSVLVMDVAKNVLRLAR